MTNLVLNCITIGFWLDLCVLLYDDNLCIHICLCIYEAQYNYLYLALWTFGYSNNLIRMSKMFIIILKVNLILNVYD